MTSSEHVSSENEDILKSKPSKTEKSEEKPDSKPEKPDAKTPKLSIRKKVSIHFKGKKEKNKLSYSSDSSIPKTPNERRGSIFDARFNAKTSNQKIPSVDTQKSVVDGNAEPKTPSSSDSKNSSDKKSDKKESGSEKKSRKSVSVSPDRKHVHVKEDGEFFFYYSFTTIYWGFS